MWDTFLVKSQHSKPTALIGGFLQKVNRLSFGFFLFALVVLANIFVVFAPSNSLMNWFQTDDAFYYFKTAQNISEGRGITFDGIGRSSGFHPLWMILCVPVFSLARFDLMLPLRIIALISILFCAGTTVLLFRLFARVVSVEAGAILALFWAFYPGIHSVITRLGMESGISAFFIVLLLSLVTGYEIASESGKDGFKQLILIGIAAVFTLFSRLDNIFLVVLLGLWLIWRRNPSLRYLVLGDFVLGTASVFLSYFLRLGFRENYQLYVEAATVMVMLSVTIKPLIFYFAGLYGTPTAERGWRVVMRGLGAVSAASILIGVFMTIFSALGVIHGFPRTALLIDWIMTLGLTAAARLVYTWIGGFSTLLPHMDAIKTLKAEWKSWLKQGLRYFLPVGIALTAYMLLHYFYFGTPSPVSGQIKHWWGTLFTVYGRPVESMWQFFGFPDNLRGGPWGLAMALQNEVGYARWKALGVEDETAFKNIVLIGSAVLAVLSLAAIALNRMQAGKAIKRLGIFPLFAACLIQIFYYNGTFYINTRHWYWVSEMVCITFLFAVVVEGLFQSFMRFSPKGLVQKGIAVVAGLVLLINFVSMLISLIPPTVEPVNVTAYLGGIRALEEVTEPGALIGSTGGGVIAYFIQGRTIVNLDGLMNSSEYYKELKNRDAYKYLDKIGLDYIYGNAYVVMQSEPYMFLFKDRLQELMHVGGTTLFRYLGKE
jgi:hypothetical protein